MVRLVPLILRWDRHPGPISPKIHPPRIIAVGTENSGRYDPRSRNFIRRDSRLALIALEKVRAFARKGVLRVLQGLVKTLDSKSGPLSSGGKVRAADVAGVAELRTKVTAHPLFRGPVIDESGTSTAGVVRLKPMAE